MLPTWLFFRLVRLLQLQALHFFFLWLDGLDFVWWGKGACMLDIKEVGWCGFPKLSLHCPADASASEVMVVAEKGSRPR